MEKYVACQFNIGRVRTDFWIWNSRLFPDFFQNNNFFFQTQGYQIGDQKMKEQSFFHDALQTCRRDWIRFDQHKKNFTCKALIVTFKKKKPRLCTPFKTLSLLYKLGKLLGKFEDFFKIWRLCMNPVTDFKRVSSVLLTCSFANDTSPILVTVMPLCCKALNSISHSYQATGTRLSSSDSLIPLRAVIIWRKICTMQQRKIMTNHCIKDTLNNAINLTLGCLRKLKTTLW